MKICLAFLSFFIASLCSAQAKVDTSWMLNGHHFRLILEADEEAIYDLNAKAAFFRENTPLLSDSLLCSRLYMNFMDMNGDGFNDLLVFQSAGARANETYHLFLFRKKTNDFVRVEGYEAWPNLYKTKIRGVLAATILSGMVHYRFFLLTDKGELVDLDIVEEDDNLDGEEFEKGLRRVQKVLKKAR
ncbi:MAG TPA: hypothetical protein VGE66_18380 [Chitinophagaceae bacterium]